MRMGFFWQMAGFFLLLNVAWYLTYSDKLWVYVSGFVLMGLLMLYALFVIFRILRRDTRPTSDE
ncbi:hypothetical protein [Ferrovum sp.]|jgi:uncharacterized membrane protein YesL|uniref:hypothetical protein n=1 Tax=Ferrovum sp. TaxID=2609467 RepID=UPI002632DEA0|nr:hypothetical protein [Ferrovum sp.]